MLPRTRRIAGQQRTMNYRLRVKKLIETLPCHRSSAQGGSKTTCAITSALLRINLELADLPPHTFKTLQNTIGFMVTSTHVPEMCVENFGSHHSNNTCHGSKHTWQHFWRIIEKLMCYLFCSAALVVPACSFHPDLAQSGVWLRSSIKESSSAGGMKQQTPIPQSLSHRR